MLQGRIQQQKQSRRRLRIERNEAEESSPRGIYCVFGVMLCYWYLQIPLFRVAPLLSSVSVCVLCDYTDVARSLQYKRPQWRHQHRHTHKHSANGLCIIRATKNGSASHLCSPIHLWINKSPCLFFFHSLRSLPIHFGQHKAYTQTYRVYFTFSSKVKMQTIF